MRLPAPAAPGRHNAAPARRAAGLGRARQCAGFWRRGRIAWLTSDDAAGVDSVRLFGGQVRIRTSRIGLEDSLDRGSESFELLNEKVTETPIQASLLLRMGGEVIRRKLLDDATVRQRFWRDARIVADVTDPRLCRVHEVGEHGGQLFIVMELLEGESLAGSTSGGSSTGT